MSDARDGTVRRAVIGTQEARMSEGEFRELVIQALEQARTCRTKPPCPLCRDLVEELTAAARMVARDPA